MRPDLFDLAGRNALVTGSSRGLGRTLARGLGRAGAALVLNGRHPDTLAEAVGDLAGPAVFLASAASDFVSGHVLYVDGGVLAAL